MAGSYQKEKKRKEKKRKRREEKTTLMSEGQENGPIGLKELRRCRPQIIHSSDHSFDTRVDHKPDNVYSD
jgi:hypothetical protein